MLKVVTLLSTLRDPTATTTITTKSTTVTNKPTGKSTTWPTEEPQIWGGFGVKDSSQIFSTVKPTTSITKPTTSIAKHTTGTVFLRSFK